MHELPDGDGKLLPATRRPQSCRARTPGQPLFLFRAATGTPTGGRLAALAGRTEVTGRRYHYDVRGDVIRTMRLQQLRVPLRGAVAVRAPACAPEPVLSGVVEGHMAAIRGLESERLLGDKR